MQRIEWVVKPSTFCNLRCEYCYEWDGLADRHAMSLDEWRSLFRSVRDYHRLQAAKRGDVQTNIVLHGGEPLVLPVEYLRQVFELGAELGRDIRSKMLVQTNLFKLSPEALHLLKEFSIGVSVSMDVIPGVRRSLGGRETEERVLDNMRVLRENQIPFGVITVLAAHTEPHIERIYDYWATRFIDFRILPLFSGPATRPEGHFELGRLDIVAALCRLFDHWMDTGCRVSVTPLEEWRGNVIKKILGVHGAIYDRRRSEAAFIVSPRGDVTHANEHGGRPYWNVFRTTVGEMLQSSDYDRSVAQTESETERMCKTCDYFGACNGLPSHELETSDHDRCAVAYDVHRYIEAHLARIGFDGDALHRLVSFGRLPTPPRAVDR
jgi:uncharacterized protein